MTAARWDRYPDRAAARRAAALALHPDRGGDAAAFAEALASIDEHFSSRPVIVGRGGGLRRTLRRILRRRRYIQL
ncbi:hypothetical protein [Mycobacterium antarcticum]|uniref:hypothetical protein n=1 Tax=unclassified Mycolicibacterium TaxID=2636767 RepID=UPI002382EB5B|nr:MULTISPECIES: hypothetical protein [unclassified Mycolicibacterium]GLP80354.1 hypothetical protein TUM20984_17740 [Mycolicibacterium sp. TUM20984]